MEIRLAQKSEIDFLARLWYDGWQDAHANILPKELARVRTLESFKERLTNLLPDTRVIGEVGNPLGLCIVKEDELYQLYVSAEARGTGVAAVLITDAEARIIVNGFRKAWLACAIGNERAATFYEKSGWYRTGNIINRLETSEGEFLLEVWRYEKSLILTRE